MPFAVRLPQLPKHIWWLLAFYCCASFVHFAHNAEFIAFYPNMPGWIARENVYWAWLAISVPGIAALAAAAIGWRAISAVFLIAYASFGLDGLGHYALALCSQHTLAMNFTIWFEVLAGVILAICATDHLRKIAAERR